MSVNVDIRRAEAKLKNLGARIPKTAIETIEREGRVAAISLSKSTVPYGTGGEAKLMGEKAVTKDIYQVYTTPSAAFDSIGSKALQSAFWKAFIAHDFARAQSVLDSSGSWLNGVPIGRFDSSLHKQARNWYGRVKLKTPLQIVVNPQALVAYQKQEVKLVGFGKAAWANVARVFGGIRGLRATDSLADGSKDITAAWILRHRSSPFRVLKQYSNPFKPLLTLTSLVRYADRILKPAARSEALRIARERMQKQALIVARYEARQAGLK